MPLCNLPITLLDGSGKSQIQATDNKDGTVELVATLGNLLFRQRVVITVSRKMTESELQNHQTPSLS